VAAAGDTGVVVLVPAADPLIEQWRQRYDPAAAQGMPAHVTVLYPFLPEPDIDGGVLDALRSVFASTAPFDLQVRRAARFPATIYLDPEPAEPFRRLTAALVERWPDRQPYGGAFDEVTPHITIADDVGAEIMDHIEPLVVPHLPLRTRLTHAQLFAFDGRTWRPREGFPFAP
jgi:2'-5' RNA ligase